jgi:hypothetical protein
MAGEPVPCAIPLWDGRAAERIADIFEAVLAPASPVYESAVRG